MWDTSAVPTNNLARILCFRLPVHAHATLSFSLAFVFPLSCATSHRRLWHFSPSHRRPSPPSLVVSLSFSSASAVTPTTTKKRLGARSTLLLLHILHSRFIVLHCHFVIHSSLRSLLFFIFRVYIAWSQNFVLPVVTEEARVYDFLLMGVEKAEADEETMRGQHGVVHLRRPGTAREEAWRRARFFFVVSVYFLPLFFLRTAMICYTFHRGYTTAVVASILFMAVRSTAVPEPRL